MKKLSTLLNQREALLQQARLANLAFAYTTLSDFAARIARGQLTGTVTLRHAAPHADRFWATLTALDGAQSRIEEHFADEDLMDFADVLGFVTGNDAVDITFRLEELADVFVSPLRVELERVGIQIDPAISRRDALR